MQRSYVDVWGEDEQCGSHGGENIGIKTLDFRIFQHLHQNTVFLGLWLQCAYSQQRRGNLPAETEYRGLASQDLRFAIVYKELSATKLTESTQKGNLVKSTAEFKAEDCPRAILSTKRKGWGNSAAGR